MRDIDKLREKIEISLDNRQVVSLVIGSLVVLGVVFVLGVMVGKQLAPQGQAAPQDLLGSLDRAAQPAAVADAGAPQVALTFQQELVKPIPAPTVPAKPEPKSEPKVEAKPEPKVEAKPEPKLEPKVEPKPEPKSPVGEASRSEVAKIEPKSPTGEASRPAPPAAMDTHLADAFNQAKVAPAPKVEAPVPAPNGGFTVQVAASQAKPDADAVMQKLRTSGLRPYLIDADIPGKGHWYRVRLGSFKNRDDAAKYVKDLKRETGYSAIVTTAK